MYDAIIIGGGASGLVCAIKLAERGKTVLIIEKQEKLGKKILATGNGRCNLTNMSGFDSAYNHNIQKYINKYNNFDTIDFFKSLGLITYADEEGRVYPISNSSASVLDILTIKINQLKIEYKLQEEALNVIKNNGNFEVKTDKSNYFSKNVVMCMGGKQSEKLLCGLNVNVVPSAPVLCSLKTEWLGSLDGVRQSSVTVSLNDFHEKGEVLFKESKISGIVIFNLSAYLVKNKIQSAIISLDLLPKYNLNEIYNILNSRKYADGLLLSELLVGIFHKQLCLSIIKRLDLPFDYDCKKLNDRQIEEICYIIKNFTIKIKGFSDNNQVFAGGISLSEVNDNLMINKISGLYACGEALDVFGKCGGYNLQWAFTSAQIVGNSIA